MSDVLMLNKKRSIICSLIPESPIGSPSTSRKPILASYFASITVLELLMFFTFKYLNFLKSLNFLKFITSLAFT